MHVVQILPHQDNVDAVVTVLRHELRHRLVQRLEARRPVILRLVQHVERILHDVLIETRHILVTDALHQLAHALYINAGELGSHLHVEAIDIGDNMPPLDDRFEDPLHNGRVRFTRTRQTFKEIDHGVTTGRA